MRTDFQGQIANGQRSLASGESFSQSSGDLSGAAHDNAQFTGEENDAESGTDHFQFRQYQPTEGRWLSPDPYDGSYDDSNPQSFNRYAYVMNNPYSFTDPDGRISLPPGPVSSGLLCGPVCAGVIAGASAIYDLGKLFGWWGKPAFHGTTNPRPSSPEGTGTPDYNNPLSEHLGLKHGVPFGGGGLDGILGLPQSGCEFGGCPGSFQQSTQIQENSTLHDKIAQLEKLGILLKAVESAYSPFHKGQLTFRDGKWFCTQHVTLDVASGMNGIPVTGESHYDLFNPWVSPGFLVLPWIL